MSSNLSMTLKKEILSSEFVEDVGFADLSKYNKIEGGSTPFDFLSNAKVGIVYIAQLDKVLEKYGKWYAVTLNNFLKQTNDRIVGLLGRHGLCSVGVIDERLTKRFIGRISFRQLAVLAGLGIIGKNSCLLHSVHGPNVLIGVVLTHAYLSPDRPLETNICLDCDVCLNKCPVKAMEDDKFNRYKCKNRRNILGKGCGIKCIICCPIKPR